MKTQYPMFAMLFAFCAITLTAACSDPEEEVVVNCGQGETVAHEGVNYCAYKGAITETGFSCPAEVPYRYDFNGGTLCGPKAGLEETVVEKIGKDAKQTWNNTTPMILDVTTNPTFTACMDIEKTQEYCAAERLKWSYDATTKVLNVQNTRAELNCCGERAIKAYKNPDGSYELLETDDKEENGRCNCMCVFDFGVDLKDIEAGTIDVTLARHILDDPNQNKETIWSGKITIPAMNAEDSIDINTNASVWCMEDAK